MSRKVHSSLKKLHSESENVKFFTFGPISHDTWVQLRCARAHWLCPTEAYTSGHRRLGGASRLLLLLLLTAACSWEAAAAATTLQHEEGGGALQWGKHGSTSIFFTKYSIQMAGQREQQTQAGCCLGSCCYTPTTWWRGRSSPMGKM